MTSTEGGGGRIREDPIAAAACMSACVAAYGVYLGLPLVLGALANAYGFTNTQIGWIGSAENAGLLLGSVAVSALARSWRYRTLAAIGIALALTGDALSAGATGFGAFCAIRLAAGFGNGLCYSAAIAALSRTRDAARNFSIFIVVLVLANSLELWVIPGIVSAWGVPGLYAALGGLYVAPLALLRFLPAAGGASPAAASTGETPGRRALPLALAWLCLGAIVLFNVAASAFWAYSERIGTSIGMSERSVSDTLTICNLISVTGSMLAYALSRRWGQHRPQLAATAVMILVFALWSVRITPTGFAFGVLLFFEVWSMASVYQLGTLSNIDATGRQVALIPAAQGIGQSAGPFIAGALLGMSLGFPRMLLVATAFAVASLIAYTIVYARLRRLDPQIAAT